jgi:hypothetical protein
MVCHPVCSHPKNKNLEKFCVSQMWMYKNTSLHLLGTFQCFYKCNTHNAYTQN